MVILDQLICFSNEMKEFINYFVLCFNFVAEIIFNHDRYGDKYCECRELPQNFHEKYIFNALLIASEYSINKIILNHASLLCGYVMSH